jgi:putative tryptophan/tyrosine transport system substrate-binding protein
MMRRREFITLLGGASASSLLWPLAARAQQRARIPVVGFLGLAPVSGWAGLVEALRAGLRDLGYVEGKTIALEFRWAAGVDDLPALAAELVRMKVDVIFAPASTHVESARQATQSIPIVFAQHADPVGMGHVASLAHPGGNITGVSGLLTEMVAKELEILKSAVPGARRIGVLWNPTTPSHPHVLPAVDDAARTLGVEVVPIPATTAAEFDSAFSTMARQHVDALLVLASPLTNSQRAPLADLALKHRLPAMFVNKANVEAGGLMSYGADFGYMYRHAATYVDKILKGQRPADLPVEQASKYQLVINLKTAKALGLEIPPTLLALADEVIE